MNMNNDPSTGTLHRLGIDVATSSAARLRRAIARWARVQSVEHNGVYREDRNYSQLIVTSTMTRLELEHRLDALNHVDHVGVFDVRDACHIAAAAT